MTIGLLFGSDRLPGERVLELVRDAEAAGIESLWLPEVFGREPFALAGYLLANTTSLQIATGIANVYARDPLAMRAGATTLAEMSGGRFMLGLGVSNAAANAMRGGGAQWDAPVAKMRAYVGALRGFELQCPDAEFPIYLAAHGPKLLRLAGEIADGAHTYLMNLAHTRDARAALGQEPVLNPVMYCMVETDPEVARARARRALSVYMPLAYYHRAWRDLGFSEADYATGGSDALIDAIVAWGDLETVRGRIQAQFDAGATRVIVIPLNTRDGAPDWEVVEAVAG